MLVNYGQWTASVPDLKSIPRFAFQLCTRKGLHTTHHANAVTPKGGVLTATEFCENHVTVCCVKIV